MAKKKNHKFNIPVPGSAPWMRKKQVNGINKANKERAVQERLEKGIKMLSAYLRECKEEKGAGMNGKI